MSLDNAWNMYIFRDGKQVHRGPKLLNELVAKLDQADSGSTHFRTQLTDLLLRAGELECALTDEGATHAPLLCTITDELAAALVTQAPLSGGSLASRVRLIKVPETVNISTPEGFAFYALHPLDFAEVASRVDLHGRFVAVIGIRSIGTTLSSVVQAALREEGLYVERTTVRPVGHPYNRELRFNHEQGKWIASMLAHRAEFLVVDEGPGMSGSSFLSVGETLLDHGVPRHSISFLCSRYPDASALKAADAATRWPNFRSYYTKPTQFLPARAAHYIAGGIWRADAFDNEHDWPASWQQMERLKFLSRDRRRYFGFEGFGRFGEEIHERAKKIADSGFGPMPQDREEGFGVYDMLRGRSLSRRNVTPELLLRMAGYCAFRANHMSAAVEDNTELEKMLRFNAHEELQVELPLELSTLTLVKPAVVDGRMLPHKWIESDGQWLKIDAVTHGDNHFFPGPTDIAWDLAGTIIEWELDAKQQAYFLDFYRDANDDDVGTRLPGYLLAYAVFRVAFCKMAAAAMRGTDEEPRLLKDYLKYRGVACKLVEDLAAEPKHSLPAKAMRVA